MTLSKVLQREPDFEACPANVPPRVRQTIRVCLRKSSRERAGDIQAVWLALDGAFETASPAAQPLAVERAAWRRVLPVAVTAVVAVLVSGLAAWRLWPTVAPSTVTRFNYDLPAGQQFGSRQAVMALSPDGRRFAYATREGLYLRTMDTLVARLIPGTEGATNPFFSPDGESVGYFRGGELRRVSVSGGAPVLICAGGLPFGASWGLDNMILFGQSEGIMRVSANGGTPELVIKANKGEQVDGPQLLPDGESVLFSVTTARGLTRWDQAHVVAQSLRTGERTEVCKAGVTPAMYRRDTYSTHWSADCSRSRSTRTGCRCRGGRYPWSTASCGQVVLQA
jgi:hypothetical protein